MTSEHSFRAIVGRVKLIITERWVLKKIAQQRYCVARKDKKVELKEAENLLIYRRVRGVERGVFNDYLIYEIDPITKFRHRIYPITKYFRRFDATKGGKLIIRVNDVIDQALNEGYLYPLDYCQDENFERLKLTKKGYGYISRLYWVHTIWNNNQVQLTINTLIQWGVPLLALYILSQFFNISLTPR